MTANKFIRLPFAALCGLILTLVAPAQVPVGHAVVGTFSGPVSSGTSGLYLLPLGGGAPTLISGLPAELQQTGGGSYQQGVASLGLRRADGALLVGTVSSAASPMQGRIELFALQLAGNAVDPAQTRQVLLGTTGNTGGALVAAMPDGRALVVASDAGGALSNGPMAGHVAAIVDPEATPPTLTLLPNPPGTGAGGGLCVDPSGAHAYYVLTQGMGSPSGVASLYRLDLSTHQVCTIATWSGSWAKGLACDDDGTVFVGLTDGTTRTHSIRTVVPDGCNPATWTSKATSALLPPAGLTIDRDGDRFLAAVPGWAPGFPNTLFNSVVAVDRATGVSGVVAFPPAGGWGLMSGAVVRNVIDPYGPSTDGQNRYWFATFPNHGGQPTRGNAGFSLSMRAAPAAPTLSALGLSLGHGSTDVLGLRILLDLSTAAVHLVPGAAAANYAMPIPNDPSFVDLAIHAQTVHLESSGQLATSRGLRITIR